MTSPAERLRAEVKSLDRPPSIQSMPNIRIIDAAHEAADLIDELTGAMTEYLVEMDEDVWCQRLRYGQCSSTKCNKAGGWTTGNPANYDLATCSRYRVELVLAKVQTP